MKRKILFLVLIVCALIFIGNRVYWFYRSGYNNLYMTISNQCNGCSETGEIVPFGIEVYIDDSLFYKNDVIDSFYVFPPDYRITLSLCYNRFSFRNKCFVCVITPWFNVKSEFI